MDDNGGIVNTPDNVEQQKGVNTYNVGSVISSNFHGKKLYFFNNSEIVGTEIENPTGYVFNEFKGNEHLRYEFPSDQVKKSSTNTFYVNGSKYPVEPYKEKIKPETGEMFGQSTDVVSQPSEVPSERPSFKEMKALILKVLPLSFGDLWKENDGFYTSGVRGKYEIGERTGDKEETWSIVNYFDTKPEIHQMILNKYDADKNKGNKSLETWLIEKFKIGEKTFDKDFLENLVERQWQSIKNGIMTEKRAIALIEKMFPDANIITYPPGSIMDRYEAVDLTINGINFQIKPLSGMSTYVSNDKDVYQINTYGMKNFYKTRNKLDYILYINDKQAIVFPPEQYFAPEDGKTSKHYIAPMELNDILK